MERAAAVDRLEAIVTAVEEEVLPVPVTEVWTYGDVALGLDPVRRLDVYVAKDLLLRDDAPDLVEALSERFGVRGVGRTVRAAWAEANPELVRATDGGHVAPERCLAAHLLPADEPVHLEVCNTGFRDNVTQRLRGAVARGAYGEVIDPRGVCLWADGRRSEGAFERLRSGGFAFPTLEEALVMIGAGADEAALAAEAVLEDRAEQAGPSFSSDVV